MEYSCKKVTYTTEEGAMLLDLSNDVGVIEQLSQH